MSEPKTKREDHPSDAQPATARHEPAQRAGVPRGNPPVDDEAVEKGRDVLDRVKPY
jgi:hypothetical protein